ncbi:MAG: aspartate carbamoyltransferase, partial [Bacteriovoracaceae bacterium]|nr:aspartate carbamoyltransferase [Bacteriovoracaceae bacterium]
KGESLQDTFKTIALYKPEFMVVRHASSGFAHLVRDWTDLPVMNAGDGQRDHPTQGLLDTFTLFKLNRTKKWKITFFGDVARSRVARSDIHLFRLLGYSLSVVDDGTEETRLFAAAYKIKLVERKNLKQADVIVCLRVQKERGSLNRLVPLSKKEISEKSFLMHPGPVMLGEDLAYELCDFTASRSLVHEQVSNGLKVRTQLISDLISEKTRAKRAKTQ